MIFRGLSTRPGRTRAQLPHPWRAVGSTVGSAVGRRVGNPVGHGGERGGARRGARWGTVGSAVGRIVERAMRPARCGWGFCTIRRIATACRRRVASLLTQFPPRDREESGKPREARWGAPWGGSGKPRGTRCRTRGKHGREVRSCPHGQRSGGAPTRTPAPNPAVSQVSHRSFDHPSGAPDPE